MINIRQQYSNIINKDLEYNNVIVRHMSSIKCTCLLQPPMVMNNDNTKTVPNESYRNQPDPECRNCGGSGYIYEEFLLKAMAFYPGFRFAHFLDTQFAMTEENVLTVYFQATQEALDYIRINDWIFFIKEDLNGNIVKPIERIKKWIIIDHQSIRLDSSKLEFVKVFAKPVIL